jgi:hypothetical protein
MGFGIRNEREEINELLRSTDTNIIKESAEKSGRTLIKPNL